MKHTQRLAIAYFSKQADVSPGIAALLGALPGGTALAALHGGAAADEGQGAEQFLRSGGRTYGEALLGGIGGNMLAHHTIGRKFPNPSEAEVKGTTADDFPKLLVKFLKAKAVRGVGTAAGLTLGGAHGAYAAAKNHNERNSLEGKLKRLLG